MGRVRPGISICQWRVAMHRALGILLAGVLTCLSTLRAEDAAITKQFRDLLAEEWEYRLREAPTFASYLGDKRYLDRWPDVSLAAMARRHEHQQDVIGR